MNNVIEITEEDGELIAEGKVTENIQLSNGDKVTIVDVVKNVDIHRWADPHMWVVNYIELKSSTVTDDNLYGMLYDYGSTEDQDSGFVYSRPELFKVTPRNKTITEYIRA